MTDLIYSILVLAFFLLFWIDKLQTVEARLRLGTIFKEASPFQNLIWKLTGGQFGYLLVNAGLGCLIVLGAGFAYNEIGVDWTCYIFAFLDIEFAIFVAHNKAVMKK